MGERGRLGTWWSTWAGGGLMGIGSDGAEGDGVFLGRCRVTTVDLERHRFELSSSAPSWVFYSPVL